MMELFHADGHLQDHALLALIQGQTLTDLERLEIAEHLSYCDQCLQRYTDLLSDADMEIPPQSCRQSIWIHIRLRTLHLLSSRYATAAAAVALSLGVLWGSGHPAFVSHKESPDTPQIPYTQRWQIRWEEEMEKLASKFSDMMDYIDPFQSLEKTVKQTDTYKEDHS